MGMEDVMFMNDLSPELVKTRQGNINRAVGLLIQTGFAQVFIEATGNPKVATAWNEVGVTVSTWFAANAIREDIYPDIDGYLFSVTENFTERTMKNREMIVNAIVDAIMLSQGK